MFQLAVEQGQLDRWGRELQTMADVVRSQGVANLLESPGLKAADLLAVVRKILPDLSEQATNLMALLAQRRALSLLPRVQDAYQRMAEEREGVLRATAVTAVPLDQAQKERIAAQLKRVWEKEIVLESRVDPNVVGGMVVRVGDHVIDGSTRSRLDALRRTVREQSG